MTTPDTPTERIERWINAHPARAYAVRFPVDDVCTVLAENLRLADAVEQLHSLILRSLPNDGSEIPQPEDPWWRAQLNGVVDRATEIYAAATGS